MARLGLFSFPGQGHVNPMAALGRRLQAGGHEVVFFQLLDLEPAVRAAGLGFAALGSASHPRGTVPRLDAAGASLHGMAALRHMIRRQTESCAMLLATLPDQLRDARFDLLLIDAIELAPHTVAEHLGIPTLTIDLLPPLFDEPSAPPFPFNWRHRAGFFGRLRNELGNRLFIAANRPLLALIHDRRRAWHLPRIAAANGLYSRRARIAQMPRFLDFPRDHLPRRFHYTGPFTDGAGRADIPFPWHRLTGQPVIYASMGTLQNGNEAVFRIIAAAIRGLDVQLVLSTGGGVAADRLAALAPPTIVVGFAPQLALLRRAALVITHAGMNTALEALSAGCPMVALPVTSDQPGIAARLARIGVAEVIPVGRVTVRRLRAAVRRVLGDAAIRERALAARAQVAELDGLGLAATLVDTALAELGIAPPTTSDRRVQARSDAGAV